MTAETARDELGSGGTEGRASEASSEHLRERGEALRVLRGNPTPEELAAVVALLSVLGGEAAAEQGSGRRSAWSDPAWRLVGPQARRGGWRVSSLPR